MKRTRYQLYSWQQFDNDIKKIVRFLRKRKFNGVWGLPRGGLPLAVCLSHALDIPLLSEPRDKKTLIVDDIADTGKSLLPYARKKYFIATVFYHRQSAVIPNIWLREKKDRWIVFPWEKK